MIKQSLPFLFKIIHILFISSIFINSLLAQWNSDPNFSKEVSIQINRGDIKSVTDCNGGLIIFSRVYNSSNSSSLFVQRLDSGGFEKWGEGGKQVSDSGKVYGEGWEFDIISDSNGGAYVAWEDYRGTGLLSLKNIYIQHIDYTGNSAWLSGGIAISELKLNIDFNIMLDKNGGVVILWDLYNQDNGGTFGQRLDKSGNKLWGIDGKKLFTTSGLSNKTALITASNTILIINNDSLHNISIDGDKLWGAKINGLWDYSAWEYDNEYYVTWRVSEYDSLYMKKFNSTGNIIFKKFIGRGVYTDLRIDSYGNIYSLNSPVGYEPRIRYLNKVDKNGNILWPNRVFITDSLDYYETFNINDNDEPIITWRERFKDRIYVQKYSISGNPTLPQNSVISISNYYYSTATVFHITYVKSFANSFIYCWVIYKDQRYSLNACKFVNQGLAQVVNFPKIFLDKSYVNNGETVIITGKDFSKNSLVKLGFAGPSGVNIPSVELTTNSLGEFSFPFSVSNYLPSGKYYLVANDIAANKFTQYLTFEIKDVEAAYALNIVKPKTNQVFETNEKIIIGWFDKLVENPLAGIGGIKREYNYKIEISNDAGFTWEYKNEVYGLAPLDVVSYFQSSITLNEEGNNFKVRVTDIYDNSRKAISESFSVTSVTEDQINVQLVWDYSFDEREGEPIGVAADGVSRIYLKITNTNPNTQDKVSKVKVSLVDGINNEAKYLGKIIPANDITAYSEEANDADQIISERTTPNFDGSYWFWYVSPDEFVSNDQDFNETEKFINANITVEFDSGEKILTSKKIALTRPPLALVHGFLSGNYIWEKFQHNSPNGVVKFLEDERFKVRATMQIFTDRSFEDNSRLLTGWNSGSFAPYNSQDNLYYLCIKLRSQGYASNQCYYVGHSMGGSIAREIYRHQNQYFRKENYYKGLINKLITINTPHNGSPWADFISDIIQSVATIQEIFEYIKMFIHPWELPTPEHTEFYSTSWEGGWKIQPSTVLNELRVQNGRTFEQTNIPSYLMVGDILPGFQPDLELPIWVWPILDENNEIIEYISEVTAQAGKLLNPIFFKYLGISEETISEFIGFSIKHSGVQTAIKKISLLCSLFENSNVILEGDGVVTVRSQSSTMPRNYYKMISIFDGTGANHLNLKKKIEVGDRIDSLLNNLIENKFGYIPATYSSPKMMASTNTLKKKVEFNNNILILEPSDSSEYNVNEKVNIKYSLTDTTGFSYTSVDFQNNTYYSTTKANQYEFNLSISPSIIDLQRIKITAVYEKGDSTIISYQDVLVNIKPIGELKEIDIYPKAYLLHLNEMITLNYKLIYDNFFSEIGEMSSNLTANGYNSEIIEYNNFTKTFRAKAPGLTNATISYQGISKKIYFEVDSIDIAIVGIYDQGNNNHLPRSFGLFQNFPNPFNNGTVIKYSIPIATKVLIKIYDILGREITSLVNEEKLAGTYEVNWLTNNIASGVYFYRLQAVDYVETRKMILMK